MKLKKLFSDAFLERFNGLFRPVFPDTGLGHPHNPNDTNMNMYYSIIIKKRVLSGIAKAKE